MALTGALALGAAGAVGACREDAASPPTACFERADVRATLAATSPERRLPDGTAISRCVELATSDEFLQNLGLVMTDVAHDLSERAVGGDRAAADQLGYLVGAVSRGAQRSQGIQLELVRRLESDARRVQDEAAVRALVRGLRAGEQRG